jgi:signal transduction histidine kinase/CheY-like chemotaxis protein
MGTMRQRQAFLRHAIVGSGVLFSVVFAASSFHDAWRLRMQLYEASERELGNLATVLAAETARSVQTVDVLLRDTASWYEQQGHAFAAERLGTALSAFTTTVPQVAMLTLVDAQGQQRHRSHVSDDPLANVADRPYFQAQRERRDTGLFINEPVLTRSIGERGLVMSRRIDGPDGRFAGVVTAIVTLDQLRHSHDRIDFGTHTELHVAFGDGTPVISLPQSDHVQPRSLAALGLRLGDGESRILRPRVEGRPKVLAATDIPGQPMVIVLLRDEAEVLQAWSTEARNMVLRTVALVLSVGLAVWAAIRQLRRLEAHERALSLSEQRYDRAMEAANEGHAEWNMADDTVYVSPRWRDMHFWPEGAETSMARLRSMVRLHDDDRRQVRAAMDAHVLAHTPLVDVEYRILTPQDTWRWIQARGRVHADDAGTAVRFYWTTTDITHRKAAQDEQSRLESQLQRTRQLESLGRMAGGIAHDFNNILGAILGYGEMAQRSLHPESPPARHLERVMQAGLRAKALVRRIIDFSRSGYGEKHPVAVQPVVEEVLALVAPTLPQGIRLEPALSAPRVTVLGEVSQLHQVVMNLCTNAIQAIDGEGAVAVTLEVVQLAQRQACSHGQVEPGPHVRIGVRDTGRGMERQVYERMFDPFFTTRAVGEGTGLGLSVTHGIVNDLGGAIDVRTEPGAGSTFTVWLPVHGEEPAPEPLLQAPVPRGRGEIVMVVDDEPALVALIEDTLAGLGYEPVGYTSSERALAVFAQTPGRFDLVLTDELLPGLQGTELVARLRKVRADLPAIVMTGHGGEGLEARARQAGVDAVLHKPLLAAELADCIDAVLCASRADCG